jgi:hypothetical protein
MAKPPKDIITKATNKKRVHRRRKSQERKPALKFSKDPYHLHPPQKDEIRFVPMHKIAARVLGGFDPEEN